MGLQKVMTRPNQFDGQKGIVIHGKAYTRSQVFSIKCECYLALRRSTCPPHTLEKYDSSTKTSIPVTISLNNIIVNPSRKRGFVLIASASGGVLHHFSLESEDLALLWIKNLQKLSSFEPLNSKELYSDVVPCGLSLSLLPSTALNYHGRCYFVVSDKDICLHEAEDEGRIVVSWPLNAIRWYGITKKMFTLKTGRSTVTGRAEFIFEVTKPLTPFHVYQEVAAKVSRSQVTINETSNLSPLDDDGEIEPLTDQPLVTDDGYETCDRAPPSEAPLDPITPDIPSHITPEPHIERPVVYTQLPLIHSVTCQLPSISFGSVSGLNASVARLSTLLGRASRFTDCGLLLYGPPDSGKKTLANALAMESQARIVCLDCASLARRLREDELGSLGESLDRILKLKPCVVLIERVEVVPLGFECPELGFSVARALADLLDRASSNPELVVVCSTARPWNVDDALRARLSEQVYVPLPSETTRERVARDKLRLSTSSDSDRFVKALVSRTSGCSVAQLLEMCRDVAIERDAQSCAEEREAVSLRWLEQHVDATNRTTDEVEASASYFVRRNIVQDTFLVTLESNRALPGTSVCFLRVTSSGLELRDLDPSHLIVSWSRTTIRGFGTAINLFQMETGRSSNTGEGFFRFRTTEADAILRMIETRCSSRPILPGSSFAPTMDYAHVM